MVKYTSVKEVENTARKEISRREALAVIAGAAAGTVIGEIAAGRKKYEIRQRVKEFLAKYPHLYQEAAKLEEYWLGLADMSVRVKLHQYSEPRANITREPNRADIGQIKNAQDAVDFFDHFPHIATEAVSSQDQEAGINFLTFYLPEMITKNKFARAVMGIDITTALGESLPQGALAMKVIFPSDIQAMVAPAVPIPNLAILNEANSKHSAGNYHDLGLPQQLLSQTIISLGCYGSERQVIWPTGRMTIQGKDIQGKEFRRGAIADGAVFLFTDEAGKWGLTEWPDEHLKQPGVSCANLIWNFNPGGIFRPYTECFFGEQTAQQHGFINHCVTGAEYEQIGPTAIFRTDRQTGESDIVFIAPFLPLTAPDIFRRLVTETPVGNSSEITDPENLIIAAPDAKYNTMYGFHPAVLAQANGRKKGAFDTFNPDAGNLPVSDPFAINNSTAFYIGKDIDN